MKATEVLEECSRILAERGAQRDKPNGERAMPLCIELFRLRTGLELSEQQGYIFMECVKQAREANGTGFNPDDIVDQINYLALRLESLTE